MHRQLTTELPGDEAGIVLSASKEIEPGARAMLLLAAGVFRLDARIVGDSLQTYVRNFTSLPLSVQGSAGVPAGTALSGEAATLDPGRADLVLTLGGGPGGLLARVTVGTLRLADHGTVRISAQAVLRSAAGSA